jgi:hypothetical protein
MSGAIPTLLNTLSWRGAQLKAQGQLYLYPFTLYINFGDRIIEDEMGGICSTHGRDENAFKILVRNVKGRDGCRWDENVTIYIRETRCKVEDLVQQVQNRDQ